MTDRYNCLDHGSESPDFNQTAPTPNPGLTWILLSRWSTLIELPASFKARSYFKLVGICGTAFFSAMGLFSVWAAFTNSDGSFKNPHLAAMIFGLFWSGFVFLGVYVLLFSRNYRLVVSTSTIEQVGAFTTRRIAIRDIVTAKWRNWPAGSSIKIRSTDSCMSIEFGTIHSEYRDWLIDFLRSTIPTVRQTDWDTFQLNPDHDVKRWAMPRFQRAMIFYAFAVSFVAAWIWRLGAVNLLAAIINCFYATFLLARSTQVNKPLHVRTENDLKTSGCDSHQGNS